MCPVTVSMLHKLKGNQIHIDLPASIAINYISRKDIKNNLYKTTNQGSIDFRPSNHALLIYQKTSLIFFQCSIMRKYQLLLFNQHFHLKHKTINQKICKSINMINRNCEVLYFMKNSSRSKHSVLVSRNQSKPSCLLQYQTGVIDLTCQQPSANWYLMHSLNNEKVLIY